MTDLYLDAATREMTLESLKRLFTEKGTEQLYIKRLAPNDNSKNQLYIGASAEDTRPVPTGPWSRIAGTSRKGSPTGTRYILQAPVKLVWLRADGGESPAPNTQMIVYPQYEGEFRLSGFLLGAPDRPSTLFNQEKRGREAGRIVFFGVDGHGIVRGFVVPGNSAIARAIQTEPIIERVGVLEEIRLPARAPIVATRTELLAALGRIHSSGWRDSKILNAKTGLRTCNGPQCIGQTLLAELGVAADGRAVPDYHGWEVKAYTVRDFTSRASKKVTLMTPEPTGGYYRKHGVAEFLRKYGSASSADPKKIYFEGTHRIGQRSAKRGTTLVLTGYDRKKGVPIDNSGGIQLIDAHGSLAAEWDYASLIEHWRNKHARAVFVPALGGTSTPKQYKYAPKVHLAVGNPFDRLMEALLGGLVVYDPGIRIDTSKREGRGETKARSQFRITVPNCLESIYEKVELFVPVEST